MRRKAGGAAEGERAGGHGGGRGEAGDAGSVWGWRLGLDAGSWLCGVGWGVTVSSASSGQSRAVEARVSSPFVRVTQCDTRGTKADSWAQQVARSSSGPGSQPVLLGAHGARPMLGKASRGLPGQPGTLSGLGRA